jgi:hypothetical protein
MGVAVMLSTPRRRQAMWFVLGLLVAMLAMSTLYSIQRTAVLAEAIRENQKSGRAVLDRVNNCTTPGRKCFDDGQRRTANAVGDITQASIYASYCAAREPGQTVAEIQACVMRQFKLAEDDTP